MKIGIFSGSFDPIHVGHLILGSYVTEFTDIDEVWFLVSPQSPFKADRDITAQGVRYHMAELALAAYPKMKASDFEFSLPTPSYTINTLSALQEAHPDDEFTLIIGGDNWEAFDKWKEYETIIERFKIMVYPRQGHRISIQSKLRSRVEALESPIVEVSSTFIREGITDGRNMQAFLPAAVYEYIAKEGLYR